MPDLTRINQDIRDGRLWKARDRLLGLLSTYPASPSVFDKIGEVYYKMGDLPAAGRYWYLADREDELFHEAVAAFEERCGKNPCTMLNELPIRGSYDNFSPKVQKRLQELLAQCPKKSIRSNKAFETAQELEEEREPSGMSIWKNRILTYVFAFLLGGPWLIGLFTLMIWLVSIIFPSFGKALLAHWFDIFNIAE